MGSSPISLENISLDTEACMHLENGALLTWRYKHFHDFLMRHLLDVHFYYVVMYFDDIYIMY